MRNITIAMFMINESGRYMEAFLWVSKVMASENTVFITPVTRCELLRPDVLKAVKINFTIFGYGMM